MMQYNTSSYRLSVHSGGDMKGHERGRNEGDKYNKIQGQKEMAKKTWGKAGAAEGGGGWVSNRVLFAKLFVYEQSGVQR